MSSYRAKFTLDDLFHNKDLEEYLPQIEYFNKWRRGKFDDLNTMIIKDIKIAVEPYMKNVEITNSPTEIVVSGDFKRKKTGLRNSYDSVLRILQFSKSTYENLINFSSIGDIMTYIHYSGVKKVDRPKLYLRIKSLEEIKEMNENQRTRFINDVMKNLWYNDNFYNVGKMKEEKFYMQRRYKTDKEKLLKKQWQEKVGYKNG